MRRILIGLIAATACLASALPAPAATTAHSATSAVSCSGGTGYTVDGNAYTGQLVETSTWNAVNPFGSVCSVSPPGS